MEDFELSVDQNHAAYPAAAHEVWREVLARNAALIARHGECMHPAYVRGVHELALPARIPRIDELNERLAPTGWKTVCVDGYIPIGAFVGLMSRCILPISRRVRRAEHIDFAPEPDLVHGVLGHLPMLFSAEFRAYLRRLAQLMSKGRSNALDSLFFAAVQRHAAARADVEAAASEREEADAGMRRVVGALQSGASELTHLRRIYVWSIEFGLLGEREQCRVHGAALLSSPAEFTFVCEGAPALRPYDVDVIHHENEFSDVSSQYFVARDFAQLDDVLSAYERRMQADAGTPAVEMKTPGVAGREGRVRHA